MLNKNSKTTLLRLFKYFWLTMVVDHDDCSWISRLHWERMCNIQCKSTKHTNTDCSLQNWKKIFTWCLLFKVKCNLTFCFEGNLLFFLKRVSSLCCWFHHWAIICFSLHDNRKCVMLLSARLLISQRLLSVTMKMKTNKCRQKKRVKYYTISPYDTQIASVLKYR